MNFEYHVVFDGRREGGGGGEELTTGLDYGYNCVHARSRLQYLQLEYY